MEVIYQVLPRFWGKGKFSDWDGKTFDYLKSLNVTAVWYTGVLRHSMGRPYVKGNPGSPYSVLDYYDVNPYLAEEPDRRMAEFGNLVRRTHKAGLKVIIDFVPNHVSPDCKDLPVYDYCDYDWTDTRKVDYSNGETWHKMLDIVLFWASKGVDGLRCDMVEMVPPEFFGWLIPKVREARPGFLFIGEAYDRNNYRRYINELGFDFLYDKSGLYDSLRAILCNGASARNITHNWQFLQDLQPSMLNFLENHDEQRIASPYFLSDPFKAVPAVAAGALFNGASYMIYAGQEVGADAAEGAEGRTSIFNWCQPAQLARLYAYIHKGKGLEDSELRLLSLYRQLFALLGSHVFREGSNYDLCWCNSPAGGFDPEKHFAFLRYHRAPRKRYADAVLVFCNFSGSPASVSLNIPGDLRAQKELGRIPAKVPLAAEPYGVVVKEL
ncbi:MAG: hypothetical protein IJ222_03860 [Bacteroidales bacterium]|nr:hypothetical protein [Bacteroidales bacterium]